MKLTDLDNKNTQIKALKENFAMDFDVSNLNKPKTVAMLNKVRNLISETKRSTASHDAQQNPAYLKLVFMEQALANHMNSAKSPRIVLENEEVEQAQVILAAQDMVDSVQKMYEDVNDMLVKELPALVDSIQSEIGVNESDSFKQTANQTLTTLNGALEEARSSLKQALGGLTGQETQDAFSMDTDEVDVDMDQELNTDEPELPPLPDMDDEDDNSVEPEVGRDKR